jgi:hypothetical protein
MENMEERMEDRTLGIYPHLNNNQFQKRDFPLPILFALL